jgi:hypothetical protein
LHAETDREDWNPLSFRGFDEQQICFVFDRYDNTQAWMWLVAIALFYG